MIYKPSTCPLTNRADCDVCGQRWSGWVDHPNTHENTRLFLAYKKARQEQHDKLWYNQIAALTLGDKS